MAALEHDHLVVRVVYTGPPLAGKTESVRALLPLLKGRGAERGVSSPGESRGRTAFFDWAEYEGGAFDGKPIRCQIIATPGQVALSDRRELLLRSADTVILVVDSRPDAIERAVQSYEEMAAWLADAGREVPIRMLLQCNKQDLPGSLPADELQRVLGLPVGKDAYLTSARTGKGLRAAFVAGVRAAVERARSLLVRGLLPFASEIETGEALLARMQRDSAREGSAMGPPSPARVATASPRRAEPAPASASRADAAPRVLAPRPGASVPLASELARPAPVLPTPEPVVTAAPAKAVGRAAPGASSEDASRRPKPAQARAPATKTWTPSAGPRPAVMPASAYDALVPRALVPERVLPAPSQSTAATARATAIASATAGAAPARVASGSARPAVMPAGAYYASLQATAPPPGAVSDAAVVPAAALAAATPVEARGRKVGAVTPTPGSRDGARPAVMPASAYFALLASKAVAAPGLPAPDSAAVGSSPSELTSSRTLERTPPVASPAAPGAEATSPRRPAVMPSSAYLATTAKAAANAGATRAPPRGMRAPVRQAAPGARPAVMPWNAWRASLGLEPSTLSPPDRDESSRPFAAQDGAAQDGAAQERSGVGLLNDGAPANDGGAPDDIGSWPAQALGAEVPSNRGAGSPRTLPRRLTVVSSRVDNVAVRQSATASPRAPQGGARPAVMPASAWREALRQAESSGEGAATPHLDGPPTLQSKALVGETGTPFRVSTNEKEVPRAEVPVLPGSTRPSVAGAVALLSGERAGTDLGHEVLGSPSSNAPPSSGPFEASPSSVPFELPSSPLAASSALHVPALGPQLPGQSAGPLATWPRPVWRQLQPQLAQGACALGDARGRFIGELAPGWYARTLETASDLRSARRAFAKAVLRQRRLAQYLSRPRCLALTEERDQFWIWQIACRVPTLTATLGRLAVTGDVPSVVADALIETALGYLDARESFASAPEPLPLAPHAISSQDGRFVYAGLLPNAGSGPTRPRSDNDAAFEEALRRRWPESPEPAFDAPAVLAEVEGKAVGRLPESILEIIRAILGRHGNRDVQERGNG